MDMNGKSLIFSCITRKYTSMYSHRSLPYSYITCNTFKIIEYCRTYSIDNTLFSFIRANKFIQYLITSRESLVSLVIFTRFHSKIQKFICPNE